MKKFLMTLITFLVICLTIWFQINFLNSIPLAGVTGNIGIVLIAGLGLVSGKIIGGTTGFVYGLIMDVALYRTLGVYTLLYTAMGMIAGFLNNSFSKDNKISMVMLILFVTLIFETIFYLLHVLLHGFDFQLSILFIVLILESAYNMLLTMVFFKSITFFGDLLNRCKNSYYLL